MKVWRTKTALAGAGYYVLLLLGVWVTGRAVTLRKAVMLLVLSLVTVVVLGAWEAWSKQGWTWERTLITYLLGLIAMAVVLGAVADRLLP